MVVVFVWTTRLLTDLMLQLLANTWVTVDRRVGILTKAAANIGTRTVTLLTVTAILLVVEEVIVIKTGILMDEIAGIGASAEAPRRREVDGTRPSIGDAGVIQEARPEVAALREGASEITRHPLRPLL
jgi:hypothetical protein